MELIIRKTNSKLFTDHAGASSSLLALHAITECGSSISSYCFSTNTKFPQTRPIAPDIGPTIHTRVAAMGYEILMRTQRSFLGEKKMIQMMNNPRNRKKERNPRKRASQMEKRIHQRKTNLKRTNLRKCELIQFLMVEEGGVG